MKKVETIFWILSFFFTIYSTVNSSFLLWPQVEYLHSVNFQVTLGEIYTHSHALRYFLVSPIYYFSDLLGTNSDIVFSFFISLLMIFIARFIFHASQNYLILENKEFFLNIILIFLIIISFVMNGRLIFGFFAMSLMYLSIHFLLSEKFFISSLISFVCLIFSGVTSGVFIALYVTFFSSIGVFFCYQYFLKKSISVKPLLLFFLIFLIFFPIFLLYTGKNITYFGGDITSVKDMMYKHGVSVLDYKGQGKAGSDMIEESNRVEKGNLFGISGDDLLMLFDFMRISVLFFILFTLPYLYKKYKFFNYILLFNIVTLLILSLFAYSIFAISLIPLFLYFLLAIQYLPFFRRAD